MKKITSLSPLFIMIALNVFSQAPKGPAGSTLYKKGDCAVVSTNFNSCTYCEDKELTKNCKEYWCTNDGTCEPAPLLPNNPNRPKLAGKKDIQVSATDTTSKLPEGIHFKDGKIVTKKGYTIKYEHGGKIAVIYKDNDGEGGGPGSDIKASIRCICPSQGACTLRVTSDNAAVCESKDCSVGCYMEVTIDPNIKAMQPEQVKWKKLVISTKQLDQ